MTPQEASQIAARKLFPASEGYSNVDKQAAIILSVFAPLFSLQDPDDKAALDKIAAEKAVAEAEKVLAAEDAAKRNAVLAKDWAELYEACQQFGRRLEGRK